MIGNPNITLAAIRALMDTNSSHNNEFLYTNTPSTEATPISHNARTFYLQPRSISVLIVQAPTELNTQHIYALNASGNPPSGLIPLAVDNKIKHKYPNALNIPIHNTEFGRICIARATVLSILNPIEIEIIDVIYIS